MPQVTTAQLAALNTRFSNRFQQSFLKTKTYWKNVCSVVPSSGESETHFWLDRIPQMRQWVGDRKKNGAALLSYVLANLPYELTEALDKFKVEDNAYRAFDKVVQMMGSQVAKFPDVLVFGSNGVLASGQSFNTYDGVGFFSTSHPQNVNNTAQGTAMSNYHASGYALTASNYGLARAAMRGYLGADGLPLGVMPNLLVTGPDLEATALNILKEEWIAPAAGVGGNANSVLQKNPFYGTAEPLVVDDLQWQTGGWWLLDTSGDLEPFIWQLREAAHFEYLVQPDSTPVFERHEYVYGASMRGAAGYGPWFKAFKASA